MDDSSTSKVTVEYYDIHGVSSIVSSSLRDQFPLRSLQRKANSRPLCFIDSLSVELVAAGGTEATDNHDSDMDTNSGSIPTQANETSSSKLGGWISEASKFGKATRRHQIPGLQQAPYVKILFFRCDTIESYKSTVRKQLKDWAKTHTKSGTGQKENYDAFEWLLVQVVLSDNTASGSGNKTGLGVNGTVGLNEKSVSSSRWSSRALSINPIDKIRQDFVSSGKQAVERVAQVWVSRNETLGTESEESSITGAGDVHSQVNDQSLWQDVISKLKILILKAFDERVKQFEEDIREKVAQRSMPGWNFCTYFVLREGLARGYESVGLVEDALLLYDELFQEFKEFIQEGEKTKDEVHGRHFPSYTEELQQILNQAKEIVTVEKGKDRDSLSLTKNFKFRDMYLEQPLNANRFRYRELIVSNGLSIFEFTSYIFTRQIILLLRQSETQGRVAESLRETGQWRGEGELGSTKQLTEICRRGISFIEIESRQLRDDFYAGSNCEAGENGLVDRLVDTLTWSWIYAVASYLLAITTGSTKGIVEQTKVMFGGIFMEDNSAKREDRLKKRLRMPLKSRVDSIKENGEMKGMGGRWSDGMFVQSPGLRRRRHSLGTEANKLTNVSQHTYNTTITSLAASRGDLIMIQREVLERLGGKKGWYVGWRSKCVQEWLKSYVCEEEKNHVEAGKSNQEKKGEIQWNSMERNEFFTEELDKALSKFENFNKQYRELSLNALILYKVSSRLRSSEALMADIAIQKFAAKEYYEAGIYLEHACEYFGNLREAEEILLLKLYAICLEKIGCRRESLRVLLRLLGKCAGKKCLDNCLGGGEIKKEGMEWKKIEDGIEMLGKQRTEIDEERCLRKIYAMLEEENEKVFVPLVIYFGSIWIERELKHCEDGKDGYKMCMEFESLLAKGILIQKIEVWLKSIDGGDGVCLRFKRDEDIVVNSGKITLQMETNDNGIGVFFVERIIFESRKLVFVYDIMGGGGEDMEFFCEGLRSVMEASRMIGKIRLVCIPNERSLRAEIMRSSYTRIDQDRNFEIKCFSGWNNISNCTIRMNGEEGKIKILGENFSFVEGEGNVEVYGYEDGIGIRLTKFKAEKMIWLRVPFTRIREKKGEELGMMKIKMKIDYETEKGKFSYVTTNRINGEETIKIEQKRIYREDHLFYGLGFYTKDKPVKIHQINLESERKVKACGTMKELLPVTIFNGNKAWIYYKVLAREKYANEEEKACKVNGLSNVLVRGRDSIIDDGSIGDSSGDKFRTDSGLASSLVVKVDYTNLEDEFMSIMKGRMKESLEKSEFVKYSRLIVHFFDKKLGNLRIGSDVEWEIGLNTIRLKNNDWWKWKEIHEIFSESSDQGKRMLDWLAQWHKDHDQAEIPNKCSTIPARIELSVFLDGSIPVLFTYHLDLNVPSNGNSSELIDASTGLSMLNVGKVYPATLSITVCHEWINSNAFKLPNREIIPSLRAPGTDKLSFVWEIIVPQDSWFIAGYKRKVFTIDIINGSIMPKSLEFPIRLVPLRSGTLTLPCIKVFEHKKSRFSSSNDELNQPNTVRDHRKNLVKLAIPVNKFNNNIFDPTPSEGKASQELCPSVHMTYPTSQTILNSQVPLVNQSRQTTVHVRGNLHETTFTLCLPLVQSNFSFLQNSGKSASVQRSGSTTGHSNTSMSRYPAPLLPVLTQATQLSKLSSSPATLPVLQVHSLHDEYSTRKSLHSCTKSTLSVRPPPDRESALTLSSLVGAVDHDIQVNYIDAAEHD